jgi:ribose/xylose/arabinose/galactoside ABC-type transport system permease subunit
VGTMHQWLTVAFYCVFWGSWMLAWETRKRRAASLKPTLLPASLLIWILAGLNFGLLMEFRWQALRIPLVFVTAGSLVCVLAITRITRHERNKAFKPAVTRMKTVSFFVLMGGLALLLVPHPLPQMIGYFCLVGAGALLALDHFQSSRQGSRPISK